MDDAHIEFIYRYLTVDSPTYLYASTSQWTVQHNYIRVPHSGQSNNIYIRVHHSGQSNIIIYEYLTVDSPTIFIYGYLTVDSPT
jgi:hypothetical protein